jgi:hypothetical protein
MTSGGRERYVRAANRLGLGIEAVVTHLGLVQALRQSLRLNLKGAWTWRRTLGPGL